MTSRRQTDRPSRTPPKCWLAGLFRLLKEDDVSDTRRREECTPVRERERVIALVLSTY
ncbi:Hypothetical protein FKW44_013641 [Caligus rogercresseyi]|uniref:Uncharacterized protein n=1 Tax=Caligus rogercresseyi TaxID=217165 RepID=A0A7T8JZE3_CALRO|nr:Hypothetical protein FKW44_013641 [Caligus rogercresseyi]